MIQERQVRLFRNGRNQAVRIPKEFELPGTDAMMRKEGDRIVITPAKRRNRLRDYLAKATPIDEPFAEIEDYPPDVVEI